MSDFTYACYVGRRWYEYDSMQVSMYDDVYLEEIKCIAAMYGIEPETVEELYNEGFTFDELEEMIYCGGEI